MSEVGIKGLVPEARNATLNDITGPIGLHEANQCLLDVRTYDSILPSTFTDGAVKVNKYGLRLEDFDSRCLVSE